MSEAATDRDQAMLAELAELDLALARKVHAAAMAAEAPQETAEFARAYHHLSRSLRQTLALKARLVLDRQRHDRARQSTDLHEAAHYYGLRPADLPPPPVGTLPPQPDLAARRQSAVERYRAAMAERFRPEAADYDDEDLDGEAFDDDLDGDVHDEGAPEPGPGPGPDPGLADPDEPSDPDPWTDLSFDAAPPRKPRGPPPDNTNGPWRSSG